jgi:hypothetical protein
MERFGIATQLPSPQSLLGEEYHGSYIIYGLLVGLIIAIVVLVTDAFWHWLPANPLMKGPSAAARAGKVFWKTLPPDAENMVVPASESPTARADQYSMSVQFIIGDSRTPAAGNYRHILHRGSNPCGLSVTQSGPSGHSGIQPEDVKYNLSDLEKSYISSGLPRVMNPGLFLDSYKNDLQIFIHTRGTEDGFPAMWLESATIEDLPLNTPITVGIVCNKKTVEIYLNCKLYNTMLLKGTPYMPKEDNQWFGRYCAFPMTGLVKELELWGTPLNSGDFIMMCRGGKFDTDAVPQGCPAAPAGQ